MMETTEVSETSVNKNLTPGKYPKESTLQTYTESDCYVKFKPTIFHLMGWDSTCGIATGYGLEGTGIEYR
jgi:hypothetical protein